MSFLELESLWSLYEISAIWPFYKISHLHSIEERNTAQKQYEGEQISGFNYQDEARVVSVSPAEGWDTDLRVEVFMQYLTAMVSVATQN